MSSLIFQDLSGSNGYIQYNGWRFPPMHNAEVTYEPVFDDSGRVRRGTKIKLAVDFVLLPGMGGLTSSPGSYTITDTTDDYFGAMRLKLQEPGKELVIINKGAGSKHVFGSEIDYAASVLATSIKDLDIENGPKPTITRWLPMTNKACSVRWECETTVLDCSTGTTASDVTHTGISYSISIGIDKLGLVTRTISGSVNIVAANATRDMVNANAARNKLDDYFPHLELFSRSYGNIEFSSDRTKLSFTIIDTQHEGDNPWFEGLENMQARHRLNSSYLSGFSEWASTLSFSCDVIKGASRYQAWLAFTTILLDIFHKRENALIIQGSAGANVDAGYLILTDLEIDDELFGGRSVRMTAGWKLFCSMPVLLRSTGLFKPLNNEYASAADYSDWRVSVQGQQDALGDQEYVFSDFGDFSKNPCSTSDTNSDTKPTENVYTEADYLGTDTNFTQPDYNDVALDDPRNRYPMSEYKVKVFVETDERTTQTGFLNPVTPIGETVPANDVKDSTATNIVDANSAAAGSSSLARVVSRKMGRTQYIVHTVGKAIRLGIPAVAASLSSVGSATAVKVGKDMVCTTPIGNGIDENGDAQIIYQTVWRKSYLLNDAPSNATIVSDGNPININA